MSFVTTRHVGSSQNRDRTRVPMGKGILNHCTTREACSVLNIKKKGWSIPSIQSQKTYKRDWQCRKKTLISSAWHQADLVLCQGWCHVGWWGGGEVAGGEEGAGCQHRPPYLSQVLIRSVSTLQSNNVHRYDQSMEILPSYTSEEEDAKMKWILNIN